MALGETKQGGIEDFVLPSRTSRFMMVEEAILRCCLTEMLRKPVRIHSLVAVCRRHKDDIDETCKLCSVPPRPARKLKIKFRAEASAIHHPRSWKTGPSVSLEVNSYTLFTDLVSSCNTTVHHPPFHSVTHYHGPESFSPSFSLPISATRITTPTSFHPLADTTTYPHILFYISSIKLKRRRTTPD